MPKVTQLRSSRGKIQTQVPLRAKVLKTLPVLFPASEDRGGSLLNGRALKKARTSFLTLPLWHPRTLLLRIS